MVFSEAMTYLVGIALVIAYFFVLQYVFGERHWLLKYLFIMGILLAGYFIPGVLLDARTQCDVVVSNSTVVVNTTSYSYTSFCYTTSTNTPDTFYQVFAWIYYFMLAYFIIKLFYEFYQYMKPRVMRFWEEYK